MGPFTKKKKKKNPETGGGGKKFKIFSLEINFLIFGGGKEKKFIFYGKGAF